MTLAESVTRHILQNAVGVHVRTHYQRTKPYQIPDEARLLEKKRAKADTKSPKVRKFSRRDAWDAILSSLAVNGQSKAQLNAMLRLNHNQIESILYRMRAAKLIDAELVTPERGQAYNVYRLKK